ncbi:MAG TPA: hypothetical protein VGM97_10085 [Steroidobacteraceae bacterium]|jgi:hypothetical protein
MKKLLFAALLLSSSAFALTCPSGFVELSQTGIRNAVTGELYTGQLTVTRTYNDSSARGDQQTLSITAGVIDACIAGGNYSVRQRGAGSSLTIAPVWTVPSTGGPYTIPDIEGSGPVTPQTSVAPSQINACADGQILQSSGGVTGCHDPSGGSVVPGATDTVPVSDGAGAFKSTTLPVSQSGAASSLVESGASGEVTAAKVIVGSLQTPIRSGSIGLQSSPSYTDPLLSPIGIYDSTRVSAVAAPYAGFLYGGIFEPHIAAANTQNWTGNGSGFGSFIALIADPAVETGATGSINSIIGELIGSGSFNQLNVTSYVGLQVHHPVVSTGSIGTAVGVEINGYSAATNNIHLMLGGFTTPTGNWNIYSSNSTTTYNNYLGAGRTLLGSTTDDGASILQVNGAAKVTGAFTVSSLASGIAKLTNGQLGLAAPGTDYQAPLGYTPLNAASNLSDLASASTARTNLGLGGASLFNVGTTTGTVAAGDDSRMTNSRTPTAHATSHQFGGSDPIAIFFAAANSIPRSGAGGTLDPNWIPTLNQSTTGNAATATAFAANPTDCSASQYANTIAASGNLTCKQVAYSEVTGTPSLATVATSGLASDLTGTLGAAQLPNPSATTLGGVKSLASASHQFLTSISTAGAPAQAQPAFTDISGTATATQLPSSVKIRAIGFTFDGNGSTLSSGVTKYLTVPFACTISAWNFAVDTGTATVKLWKVATGTAIPTVANSINTSGVSIASGTAIHSTTVTDFTSTAVSANDIIGFNLFAVSSATYVNFMLECDQ